MLWPLSLNCLRRILSQSLATIKGWCYSGSTGIGCGIPRRLVKSDYFTEYQILLEPGEYALSSFDIKVAESASRVRHLVTGAEQLVEGDDAPGGTFNVANGEIVYIGHFELDCIESPIPWRYYIDSRERFESFVARLWNEYPFLVDKPVQFRLFSTTRFGLPFSLDDATDD